MKHYQIVALVTVSLLGLFASGCVGLVQIGKGPLRVGEPKSAATPEASK